MEALGLDIGNFQVKGACAWGTYSFLSLVGRTYDRIFSLDDGSDNGIFLESPKTVVGEAAGKYSPEETPLANRDLLYSDDYMALYYAALSEARKGGGDLRVVAGLPISLFKEEAAAIRDKLSGEHTFKRAGRRAQTVTVKASMMPQHVGALFNVLMTENGQFPDEDIANEHLGVIDIGGGTVGFAHLYEMETVKEETFSKEIGGNDILLRLNDLLAQEYRGLVLRRSEVFQAIKRGKIVYEGQVFPIDDLIQEASRPLSTQILSFISTMWKTVRKFRMLLLTGCGAYPEYKVSEQIMKQFPFATIDNDPKFGNALGFRKMAKRLLSEEAEG